MIPVFKNSHNTTIITQNWLHLLNLKSNNFLAAYNDQLWNNLNWQQAARNVQHTHPCLGNNKPY